METSPVENINIAGINIELTRKKIKNIHIKVYPPEGMVKISAPKRMDIATIYKFVISMEEWIKKHQEKLKGKTVTPTLKFVTGEEHFYLGNKYILKIIERHPFLKVRLHDNNLNIYTRKNASIKNKRKLLNTWYSERLEEFVPQYIPNLEKIMGVKVFELGYKTMKGKWGTCNLKTGKITLNTELAKKSPRFIEYVLIHEMVHLLEGHHNKRFYNFMDMYAPNWKELKKELNHS